MSYSIEWHAEDYLPPQHVTIRLEQGRSTEIYRYPEDPFLPGLKSAANPDAAHRLVSSHVLNFPARRLRVERVKYRSGSRAVLRHLIGKVRLYVRVMRPTQIPVYLKAGELADQSGFSLPRVVGHWKEGATIWLSEIPGKNLRRQIRRGYLPDPTPLLEGLESLWNVPLNSEVTPFNLSGSYHAARQIIVHALKDDRQGLQLLKNATGVLDRFTKDWHPSTVAHNDFYDDQMLVLPDGRIVLVDFEEAGAGDPMHDVGTFLAHLKWRSLSRHRDQRDASGTLHRDLRDAALERFGWIARDLDLREAVYLFRLCTDPITRPRPDWRQKLDKGLTLVNTTLS